MDPYSEMVCNVYIGLPDSGSIPRAPDIDSGAVRAKVQQLRGRHRAG